jgi:hypothetical protein
MGGTILVIRLYAFVECTGTTPLLLLLLFNSSNNDIIVAGDYNARVGKIPIDGILGTNGEITINNNGHKLKEFASISKGPILDVYDDDDGLTPGGSSTVHIYTQTVHRIRRTEHT